MGAFSMAYPSEIVNKKSVTFTATLFNLLFRRLVISLAGCSPAEPVYVSNQSSNIKKQSDTVCFTLPCFKINRSFYKTRFPKSNSHRLQNSESRLPFITHRCKSKLKRLHNRTHRSQNRSCRLQDK